MTKLQVQLVRVGSIVVVCVSADGVVFDDQHYMVDEAHAEGIMSDAFHYATMNRYKEPTTAIHDMKLLKGI